MAERDALGRSVSENCRVLTRTVADRHVMASGCRFGGVRVLFCRVLATPASRRRPAELI